MPAESPSNPRALIRTILLRIGNQRSPHQAQACDTLFGFLDEAQAIRDRLREQLAALGLSEGKFFTLTVLHGLEPEPSTPATLARHAGVTRASMTAVIDQLVQAGWVSRGRSQVDRRQFIVRLTPAGIHSADRAIRMVLSTSADVLAGLQARRAAPRALNSL